ncbi:hypothetical protein Tco_0750319 [Tanacetum coccineum]|uniref:Aminotransferase-like plant mobile domain-containing protein n=1 Tax=Tanacetum coccineum TaxID=301880 RepID=A0ABQ4Z447_9ASTR
MSEEDQTVEVVPPVKSDMHSYSSTMTAKDVKALALKHNIPMDLHPVALTAEWTMDKLTDDFIGLYEQYFEFSGVRVPFSTLLLAVLDHFRMHISQLVPIGLTRLTLFELYWDWFTFERRVGPGSGGKILNETFSGLKGWKKSASDVATLTSQSIDIRPVPSGLLFHAGLATTWEFFGFLPVFKDTEGNDGATIGHGDALSARNPITQRTTGPLPVNQSPLKKTARLKEVETSDPKIVSIRERKDRAAAKKRAKRKRSADGEGGSKGKTKRRKVSAVRAEEEDSTEEPASPLRAMAPNPSLLLKDVDDVETAKSREDEHVIIPRHDSANTSIHNYAEDHDESFNKSEGHGLTMTEMVEIHHANETRLIETPVPAPNPEKTVVQDIVPVVRSNLAGDRADGAESSRPGSVYVPEWTIHRRGPKLARKDSALVFSDRISNERAAENERLVSQLGFLEKEKIDSIGKLLPTVVRRLLNSHEYKESLSVPFNLAIQAGWAKGLAMKRSEEDLMDVLREVQGFDPHSDTRMTEVLKMYPFLLQGCPTKVNPSSKVTSVSRAVPSKVIPTATTTVSKVTPFVTRSDKNPGPSHPLDSSKSAPKRG